MEKGAASLMSIADLPPEITIFILHEAVGIAPVTSKILPFVCHQWKDWKLFWEVPPTRPLKPPILSAPASDAARFGWLNVLKWLREQGCPWSERTCARAAREGHLEILKWLRELGCPWNEMTGRKAACKGHLNIVQWMVENGFVKESITICDGAASGGQLEVLKWAREHGCLVAGDSWIAAALKGKIDILKYLDENGVSMESLEGRICARAKNGYVNVMQFLPEEGYYRICIGAAMYGHLDVLVFLHERGYYQPSDQICHYAAGVGNIEMLKWAREHGCEWSEPTCSTAADNGHLDVLKWLREQGCPWDGFTLRSASFNGRWEVLNWAKANGCPWEDSSEICSDAAMHGNLEMLQWAVENGAEVGPDSICRAAKTGCKEVLEWLISQHCPWNHLAGEYAACGGHLEILKLVHSRGVPLTAETFGCAIESGNCAIQGGNIEMLKWLIEQKCPWDSSTFARAIRCLKMDELKWLKDQGCPWDESSCSNAAAVGRLVVLK